MSFNINDEDRRRKLAWSKIKHAFGSIESVRTLNGRNNVRDLESDISNPRLSSIDAKISAP